MSIMKRLFFTLALLITSVLYAEPTTKPTPVVSKHPHIRQINLRIRNQWYLIETAGIQKFTQSQEGFLLDSLENVRKQEKAFLKENKSRDVTTDQQNQLNLCYKNTATVGETTDNNN